MTAPAYLDCPKCDYPLDPAALPYHPDHDLTPEQIAACERDQQALEAQADAQRWARIRADEQRARRAAARSRRKK